MSLTKLSLAVWFRVNKFAVNINKTKYMVFRMKGKNLIICLIFYIMKMNLAALMTMHLLFNSTRRIP
jgi:hypothetical protein